MSARSVAETSTYTTQTQDTNIHAQAEFEPAIPASERPQIYALRQPGHRDQLQFSHLNQIH
jgi:hypothetical protein